MPEKPVCMSTLKFVSPKFQASVSTANSKSLLWMANRLLNLFPTCVPLTAFSISNDCNSILSAAHGKKLGIILNYFHSNIHFVRESSWPYLQIYAESMSPSQTCYSNLLLPCSEPPALACYYLAHLHSLYSTQSDHFQIKVKSWYFFVQTPIACVSLRMKARVLTRADKAIADLFPHASPSCSPH